MITYSEIYELLRKDKYSEQLQKLPKDFFREISDYFAEKEKISSKEGIFSDTVKKTKKELENALVMVKDLMAKRQEKIVRFAMVAAKTGISKRDVENMLEYERELFDKVARSIEEFDKSIAGMISGEGKEKDLKNRLVRFKQDMSEFAGMNGNVLGPFKEGEIANIPKEIAEILLKAEQVEVIEE